MQRLGEVDGLREDLKEVLRRRHPGRLRWVQKDEILREDHLVLRPLNRIDHSDLGDGTVPRVRRRSLQSGSGGSSRG